MLQSPDDPGGGGGIKYLKNCCFLSRRLFKGGLRFLLREKNIYKLAFVMPGDTKGQGGSGREGTELEREMERFEPTLDKLSAC